MLSRQERADIRKCIGKAAKYGKGYVTAREALGTLDEIALIDTPRLLDALDQAQDDIHRLKSLVEKLYKIVNLASLTDCDHRCFTTQTREQLFATLAQARAVTTQTN